ncbi:MAG: hypothetical protein AMJ60_07120 [Desulfobacterales bacterium SG8_35]|nr:MAG: hypothetical protein AMJ60_07120 [Desulfobacterales bacterium SG8_35]
MGEERKSGRVRNGFAFFVFFVDCRTISPPRAETCQPISLPESIAAEQLFPRIALVVAQAACKTGDGRITEWEAGCKFPMESGTREDSPQGPASKAMADFRKNLYTNIQVCYRC